MKVEVITPITHNDKIVQPGETVVLEQSAAAILIGQGVVKEVSEKSAAPAASPVKET